MPEENAFRILIARIRSGDQQAATELVREYEPAIRRAIRVRLTDARLGRVLDSMDICQSVLANFFVRTAAGQIDLAEPAQLLKLLVTMARNKFLDHLRHYQAERRDQRRIDKTSPSQLNVAAAAPSPSRIIAGQELLQQVKQRLSPENRYLVEQRALGREWAEVAAEMGVSPEALRKQLSRALNRLMKEMNLDETHHA